MPSNPYNDAFIILPSLYNLAQFGVAGTNYCGPGFADGKFVPPGQDGTYVSEPTSITDGFCNAHDQGTDAARKSPNPSQAQLEADTALFEGIAGALASGLLSATKGVSIEIVPN